jgi:hypothetical protein
MQHRRLGSFAERRDSIRAAGIARRMQSTCLNVRSDPTFLGPGRSRGAKSFALDGCCHSARFQCSLFEYAMFRGRDHAIPASGGGLVPAGYPPHLATIEAESDIVAAVHHFRLTHQFVLFLIIFKYAGPDESRSKILRRAFDYLCLHGARNQDNCEQCCLHLETTT